MKKRIIRNSIIQAVLFLVLIAVDQFTKYLAVTYLQNKPNVPLISGVLEFQYLENNGAAFNIFQNRQWLFYIITALVLIVIFYLWGRVVGQLNKYCMLEPADFRPKTFQNGIFLNYILTILAAGAIGNLIDRIRLQYVIDFIYVKLIQFPIFNVADICVSVSAVLLVIYFIFVYKEDPNFHLFGSNKKES